MSQAALTDTKPGGAFNVSFYITLRSITLNRQWLVLFLVLFGKIDVFRVLGSGDGSHVIVLSVGLLSGN